MISNPTLRTSLVYEPQPLQFGTSGRRGEVIHLTQLEIYLNALAELEYLQSLSRVNGGIVAGDEFYYAYDLRPSSTQYVPAAQGRGEIAQAIAQAIRAANMRPINLGYLPTPALTCYALAQNKGSIMITGSHIPFTRNGYKCNTAIGELRKQDEAPINARVIQVRDRLYQQPFAASPFDEQGMFKAGHQDLPQVTADARANYIQRYLNFFVGQNLRGWKLLVYQHSAVGRDLLVEILQTLGAMVITAGRSNTFVPIDTENIDDTQLAMLQQLLDENGPVDAIVSTDGDSDRPLLIGIEHGRVHFYGGDLIGMLVAEYLGADAVVVPISCNDAIDRGRLQQVVAPKTKIGSPFVIEGMKAARDQGKKVICGWEANGGFLTESDITHNGNTLSALPTRDAVLPILAVLFYATAQRLPLTKLFAQLPQRFSRAALLANFPRCVSQQIITTFRTPSQLTAFFTPAHGFTSITSIDHTDGTRIYFSNGDIAHIRPSGNADELRIYAVADTQARADAIVTHGIAEPYGILRQLAKELKTVD